jgi:hypothetical protein
MDTVYPDTTRGGPLIAGSRVSGTPVFNPAGGRLGTVEDVMIDKQSGRIAYAVLGFGGFLGIGDKHHPLPWQALHYDPAVSGYVVNLDRAQLEGAPVLAEDSDALWQDRAWGKRVHDYYNVSPYWSILP